MFKKNNNFFYCYSNSGKTTLVVKVSSILQSMGYKVCIIKHYPKDKASFNKEGKDSFKFFQSEANTCVLSPNKTSYFFNHTQ